MNSLDMTSFVAVADVPEDVGVSTFLFHMYKTGQYTDVVFELLGSGGVVKFRAHKFVLSLWSPYFADKFYANGKMIHANVTKISLSDTNPEVFETIVKYTYGYVPEFESFQKTCELYKMAKKFQIASLMESCCAILSDTEVSLANVFDMLDTSTFMKNQGLIDKCLRLIQENTEQVMEAYDLSRISSSMLHLLLDLPSLSLAGEYDLLMWVFAWGKNHYIENPPKYKSVREVLQPFFSKLQFLSLSNAEFTMLYMHRDALFTKDEALRIFMNIGIPGSTEMPSWYDSQRSARMYTNSPE